MGLYLLLIEYSFDLGFNLASFCALVPKEIELEAREINHFNSGSMLM